MNIKKCFLSILFILASTTFLFGTEFKLSNKNYDISGTYQDSAFPGQAIFIRMKIKSNLENKKINIKACAELIADKSIAKADFYYIKNDELHNNTEVLVALPMWSWQKPYDKATIIVTYSVNDFAEKKFKLPISILEKEYPHETIHLNSKLSDLIGTPDLEKKEQSRVLNETLATINPDSIYEYTNFAKPTTGQRITSEFGQTRTFVYSNGKESPSYHAGLDFGVPTGSQITACGAGKVVMARWRIVTGYSVIIEHLPGLYSIYYHLSELKCHEGDIVKKGDLIALSGATGLATGPHLHWEIRLNSVCLDPESFLKNFAFE